MKKLRDGLLGVAIGLAVILAAGVIFTSFKNSGGKNVDPGVVNDAPEQTTRIVPRTRNDAPFVIGVLYWSMNIPGQVAMRKGLEAEAERINADSNGTQPRVILEADRKSVV